MMIPQKAIYSLILSIIWISSSAQKSWENSTYPDEEGFLQRTAPMLTRIAAKEYGKKAMAFSKCPETGLPVYYWALEGETIYSPYTGKAYTQGPTGYFGPKARNDEGEIIAFGGDPLKRDLPPATAALLLDNNDIKARSYLSIPGNLRQQYHFACTNWARFYPLLAKVMGAKWKTEFHNWVSAYTESRRPSDGYREHYPLSTSHNLVGEPGELLGGNTKDGGTENHKTMWRTSGLLYSQIFPDTSKISGYSTDEAKSLIMEMIRDYLKKLLVTGNGEYDSQVYYPHTIEAFLNLYDFTPDKETKALAKFALDYYFVTFGLKVIDGTVAGAQKRGYLPTGTPEEMEIMQHVYFDNSSADMSDVVASIQQSTTTYRPNKVIRDIVRKNVPLPFEAKMSRPFYHMDHPHAFAETFYCSDSYGMGNIQMTIVDNPNQQMIWSLIAKGTDGPLCFSGGHPLRGSTSGHSPYTQTLHSKGSLILMTAPTKKIENTDTKIAPNYSKTDRPNLWHLPEGEQGVNYEIRNRQKYASEKLHPMKLPEAETAAAYQKFWEENKGAACSWLYFPASLNPTKIDGNWYFEANNTYVAIIPLTKKSMIVVPPRHTLKNMKKYASRFFNDYSLLVFPGKISGFIVETGEKSVYPSLQEFNKAIKKNTSVQHNKLQVNYQSLHGDNMQMEYNPIGLRCNAIINGKKMNWDNFTDGAVYQSPYIKVKEGRMTVKNGIEGYTIDFTGEIPEWKEIKQKF